MVDVDRALSAVSEAVLGIAGDLSLDVALERLVGAARELAGARYAALGVPDDEEDGGFARFITAGMTDAEVEAMGPLPRTHGLLGAMLTDPIPFRTADITADPRFRGWWPGAHPRMRSFLGVPIVFKGDVIAGAFYLTDKPEGPGFTEGAGFTEADEQLVGVLAAHAAVLIEHARLYEGSRELSVLDERNRLARDLHDAITQSLFSLRLTIETAASMLAGDPSRAGDELERARALVEALFVELRSLIFELRPPALDADGLVGTVRKHLEVVGRANDLAVEVTVTDDRRLPDAAERELFRIVQEAVNNVVRHAQACSLTIALDLGPTSAKIAIHDDGIGFVPDARPVRSRRLGLTSMKERAQRLGGKLAIESSPGQGTTVRVEAPVDPH